AYPCSALQEGLIAMAEKQPGSYITKYFFRIPDDADLERWMAAWETTVEVCGNLRTRILPCKTGGRPMPELVQDDVTWEAAEGVQIKDYLKLTKSYEMTYASRLCRYAIISHPTGENYFGWIIHHSVIDGWSVQIAIKTLHAAYWGEAMQPSTPYSGFIKYTS